MKIKYKWGHRPAARKQISFYVTKDDINNVVSKLLYDGAKINRTTIEKQLVESLYLLGCEYAAFYEYPISKRDFEMDDYPYKQGDIEKLGKRYYPEFYN